MRTQFIADSTFVFEHNGCRILTDPWIGTQIYGGAWMQYPPPAVSTDDIGKLDYIFISHIHEDHCDPLTIEKLDRNAKIVIMDRQPNFVLSFLKKYDFGFADVLCLPPFETFELSPGLAIEPLEADPAKPLTHMVDSSMALHTDACKSYYFGNDNSAYPDLLKHLSKYDFELALLPAAGGAGYPACYKNLSADDLESELKRIKETYYGKFSETVASLKPDYFMAVAGYHIISGRNYKINKNMSFLTNPAIAYERVHEALGPQERAKIKPLQLESGETVDLGSALDTPAVDYWDKARDLPAWEQQRDDYLDTVAAHAPYAHDSLELPSDLDWRELFMAAGNAALEKAERASVDFQSRIYVRLPSTPEPLVGVYDGVTQEVRCLPHETPRTEPYQEISCDDALLYQLLTGDFSWNIADAACFLTYDRHPNVFEQSAFIALNYLSSRKLAKDGIAL